MVHLILSIVLISTASARSNDYKQKCLKRLICTNYVENTQGEMEVNNSEFFNLQLQASCHLSPQDIDVQFYGDNNLTFTVKNNPTVLTNCSAADIDPSLAFNKENCDLKKQELLELRLIAQIEPYQKVEDGKIVHICDGPDEIVGPAEFVRKSGRLVDMGIYTSASQPSDDFSPPPWEFDFTQDNCMKCSEMMGSTSAYPMVRSEGGNECVSPDRCPIGMRRVSVSSLDIQLPNNQVGAFGGFVGSMQSFEEISDTNGERTTCVPECIGGTVLNPQTLTCEFRNCEELYLSLTSHLSGNPPLPQQLGTCEQADIQAIWMDYKGKAKAYAESQKKRCNKINQSRSSLLKTSSNAPGVMPIVFSSLSFAQVALPLCGVVSKEEILAIDADSFNKVSIKPEAHVPMTAESSRDVLSKLYDVELNNNGNGKKSSGELRKIKGKDTLGWPNEPFF